MSALAVVGWAIVGWCGTPWRGWWRWPPPPPPPDSITNPWVIKILGVVGGIVGGWAFGSLFTADLQNPAGLLVTFAGALAGSVIANDFYDLVAGGRKRA